MKKAIIVTLLLLSGCRVFTNDSGSLSSVSLTPDERPTATISMQAATAAFIGTGQGGEGTLYFNGKAYPFYVGGLGIGGIGASTIEATGDVYRLNNIGDFPGAYSQVRYGAVAGTASTGEMWLNNPDGVIIHLQTQRTGLMLSLGGDAMVITLK
ncbi:MAG: hypothetical protein U1E66_06600 [Rhodospirillales bacterium]